MFNIEQVALRSSNIERDITQYRKHGHTEWIQDRVHAVHIYVDPTGGWPDILGIEFAVDLAFNYTIISDQEFELIHLVSGMTCQFADSRFDHLRSARLSHLGYHVLDQSPTDGPEDTLLEELLKFKAKGATVLQVSQTIDHKNTPKRYRYAFALGVIPGDLETPVKIIQRIEPPSSPARLKKSLLEGMELFKCLAA